MSIYWHHKMEQTKSPVTKKKYRKAWEQASKAINNCSFSQKLSTSDMEGWLIWAKHMTRQFHRSSSAVEGRNGAYHKCIIMTAV